jgi:hypothetical protein
MLPSSRRLVLNLRKTLLCAPCALPRPAALSVMLSRSISIGALRLNAAQQPASRRIPVPVRHGKLYKRNRPASGGGYTAAARTPLPGKGGQPLQESGWQKGRGITLR